MCPALSLDAATHVVVSAVTRCLVVRRVTPLHEDKDISGFENRHGDDIVNGNVVVV